MLPRVLLGRRAVSLVLLLVSAGLAGCFDEEAPGPAETDWSLLTATPTPVQPSDYQRFLKQPAPERCDGCVPLAVPEKPEKPARASPTPAPEARPTFFVPLPREGDLVMVGGTMDPSFPPGRAAYPWPAEPDGAFRFDLHVVRDQAILPTLYDGVDELVRFDLGPYIGDFETPDGRAVSAFEMAYFLSLRTGHVVETYARGFARDGAALVPGTTGGGMHEVQLAQRSMAGSLVTLGAHLWGRTLAEGESFEWTWRDLADPDVSLSFKVVVDEIAPDRIDGRPLMVGGGDHAGPSHTVGDMAVTVTVRDHEWNLAIWRLVFDDTSAYPVSAELQGWNRPVSSTVFPPRVAAQTNVLARRGELELPLHGTLLSATSRDPRFQDPKADLDPVLGPAVLSTAPSYGLDEALLDLRLLEPTFPAWENTHTDRVLVAAELDVATYLRPGDAIEWHLTYSDGHSALASWAAARPLLPNGDVGRVPLYGRGVGERAEAASFDRPSARELHNVDMGSGELLLDAARDAGFGDEIDRAWYRLQGTPGTGLSAELAVGRAVPTAMLPSWVPVGEQFAGYVVEDLFGGIVVARERSGPHETL